MKSRMIFGIGLFGFLMCGSALDCPNWILALVCCIAFLLMAASAARHIKKEQPELPFIDVFPDDLTANRESTFQEWLSNTDMTF